MNKYFYLWVLLVIYSQFIYSQSFSKENYELAKKVKAFDTLVYNSVLSQEWIDESNIFWYSTRTADGIKYYLVNAEKKSKKEAFNNEKFCRSANNTIKTAYDPQKLMLKSLKFDEGLKSFEFTKGSMRYKCHLQGYKIELVEVIKKKKEAYWGNTFDELSNNPVISPDSLWVAYINNYNVYIKNRKTSKEYQLSYDGSKGSLYSSYIYWSPDSKKIADFRIREAKKRYMYFVESTPDSAFLPKLHRKEYLRPGDALPIKTPVLFSVEDKKQLEVQPLSIDDQFSLDNLQWNDNSKAFTFEYNQRGHQVYQVIRVDAETGKAEVLINETSETFIDYSGKRYRFDVEGGKEIIWASERDGWNHLYLFNGKTGSLINQITKGEWVVRNVIHVDEKERFLIFAGSGKNNDGEDPYNIHYYKINLDGTNLVELTPEKFNHNANFSSNNEYFLDTYSNPFTAPFTVLRDTKTGKVLFEVEKADISRLLKAGYIMPEPFVAKGRDGKTDIWGNIYRPTNFDSTRLYPIIEYIYAGPQSSYVQKSFRPYFYSFSELAELGFIIVQIDGMGTSNRSKAFHDVCYKNIKDAGFDDRILWIKAAARRYPYMDTTRVGIFGGSAGGQNSTAALLLHPEFYKAGVSSCGCHDNRLDKIWWNEQWMGYPIGPEYKESSNIENADKLKGNLMLIVGEMDDNVDPSSTYRLADALIKAGKEFELVVLPGVSHTLGGNYGERKRKDFFIKHLLKQTTPSWNSCK